MYLKKIICMCNVCFICSALTVHTDFVDVADGTTKKLEPQVDNNGEWSDRYFIFLLSAVIYSR